MYGFAIFVRVEEESVSTNAQYGWQNKTSFKPNAPVQRRAAQRTVRCNRLLCRAVSSVSPLLMRERRAVQLITMNTPRREQRIHPLHESVVVMPLVQMHQLVDQHVLQAPHWLLDEFQVQPNAPRRDVAASPARLHPLDPHLGHRLSNPGLPFGEQRRKQRPELAAVPAL